MNELYRLIEEKIKAAGYPGTIDGREFYDDINNEADNQDNGKYQIVTGLCEGASGPYNFGTHLWAKFDDLDAWEDKLINGPYIHHVVEIEGDYREEIKEFCKFVPNLELDPVE